MKHFSPASMAAAALALASSAPTLQAQTIERVRLTDNELSCTQIYAEVQQMDSMVQLAGTMSPAPVAQALPVVPVQPTTQLSAIQQAVLNHPNNANLTPEQKATLIAQTGLAETRGNAAVAGLYAGAPTANALRGSVIADPGVQAAIARARAAGMSEAQIAATVGVGMQQSGLGAAAGGLPALAGLAGLLPGMGQQAPAQAPVSAGQAYAQAGGLAGMLGAGISAQGGMGGAAGNAAGLAGMFGALAGSLASQQAAAATPAPAPVTLPVQAGNAGGGMAAQARARKEHLTGLFLSRGCKMADVRK
ncbi:MAG: hypothetical protein Q7T87_06735 [Polaromonas sp.]|nr:hypothetical protein [Polaromonas sp.]